MIKDSMLCVNKLGCEETVLSIAQQASWLESLLSCKIRAVSFHQPSKRYCKQAWIAKEELKHMTKIN